ncbi:MAG: hypothetical protein JXA21_02890 [Anaerolineae bacterium]|nr:hypothetical protein [Anaerolineae bacterium]
MDQVQLPGSLKQRVQAALLRCGPFDSARSLRATFVDERIAPWHDYLPETAPNRAEQVNQVIDTLIKKSNDRGKNALVLLLTVLSESVPSGDSCRGDLMSLAEEVAAALKEGSQGDTAESEPGNRHSATPEVSATQPLRDRLKLLDDAQFEALCLDHFPTVYDQFSRGLQREQKLTMLLDYVRKRPGKTEQLAQLIGKYE